MKASLFVLVSSLVLASSAFAAQDQAIKLEDGQAISVLRVQQYRNFMPVIVTDPNQPAPNPTVTLIDFTASACTDLQAEDYKVVVEQKETVQVVQVKRKTQLADCRAVPHRQELSLRSKELLYGKPIVVVNPVEVHQLPDVY